MSNNTPQLLNSLRDIHLPEPISIWPLAPGWYAIIILVIILLLIGFYCWLRRYWRNRAKQQALAKLARLNELYQHGKNQHAVIAQLSILLKRVALAYFPKYKVAGLHGERWLRFLDRNSQIQDFSRHAKVLITAPYQAQCDADLNYLFPLIEQWIKNQ